MFHGVSNGFYELQDQASLEYKKADTINRDLRTQYRAYMSKAKSISTRQSVLTTTNDIPVHGVRRSDQVVIDNCIESGHIGKKSRDNGDESRNNDESGHIAKETRHKREESRNKHELGHITDESKYSKDESEDESEHIRDKSRRREDKLTHYRNELRCNEDESGQSKDESRHRRDKKGQIKDESEHSADESRRSKGELVSKQTIRTGIGDGKHKGTDHTRCASRRKLASSFSQSQLVQGGEFDQKEHM